MLKIGFDLLMALISLVLVAPVILLVALIVGCADRQNPFFVQERLGKLKTRFWILKLRTMKKNHVTPVGKILRKTGIDELPQLINILSLQMSFVGPRPLTETDVERLGWNDSFHAKRWLSRPGITGLAQVSPVCNKRMSWFLDQKYISCRNFLLDLKILAASVAVLVVGKQKAVAWIHTKRIHEGTR